MQKVLGKALIAVLVAAAGTAVAEKKYPGLLKKASGKALKALNAAKDEIKTFAITAKDAFREGYVSSRRKKTTV